MGETYAEVGLKPQLSPSSCATKEEDLKPLLTAVGTMDLNSVPVECPKG